MATLDSDDRHFSVSLTPITAPVYNISGLKDARTGLQTIYFSAPITSTFNAMCFDENPFTCQRKKEDRNS